MKFFTAQLAYFMRDVEVRKNIRALGRTLLFIVALVVVYALLFLLVKRTLEEETYTFWTGIYWTLVTMSTLGYGDITFETDLGRLFSIWVLFTGVVTLLIVLPFAFIRYFYAPWLEAQIKLKAPRRVPGDVSNHIIITHFDPLVPGLVNKIRMQNIPYFVLETDPTKAADLIGEGFSMIAGERESVDTYKNIGADRARLLFANGSDTDNTNTTITVRELSPTVEIVAIANSEDSIDILELAGCTKVLPLKRWLGESLANRVNAGKAEAHVIGSYRGLRIAEFPVHNTPMAGQTIRQSKLRQVTGLSIVGVWSRGRFHPATPDYMLTDHCVPVVVGTPEQIEELDALLIIYDINPNPVIIIGGGKVGRAACRALKRKGVPVVIVDKKPEIAQKSRGKADKIIVGDAADREVLFDAGLREAPSVILTTNDDATNIYLAVYCRRLNEDLRIVCRVTHERNIEAMHRAGADFVLSYGWLGVNSVLAVLHDREVLILGEGIDFFYVRVPRSLENRTLAESEIGAHTGLSVVALHENGQVMTNPQASTRLDAGIEMIMMGTPEQRQYFHEQFEKA